MPWAYIRHYCLLSVVVFAGLLQPLTAQATPDWKPGTLPMGARMGLGAAFPVVKGQPYTAEILYQQTYTLRNGTKRLYEAHNIVSRDSQGRLLSEDLPSPVVKVDDGELSREHGFVLDDPIRMVYMQWSDSSQSVLVSAIPDYVHKQSDMWTMSTLSCPVTLGERVLHGVIAKGCRSGSTKAEGVRAFETWRSEKLRIELLTLATYPDGTNDGIRSLTLTESRMEVTRLDLGEPDQTHFEPPPGYKQKMIP
jgi:hypothetical protein